MFFIIGLVLVLVSVIGLYGIHGSYAVLWQPIEFGIIFGGHRWRVYYWPSHAHH